MTALWLSLGLVASDPASMAAPKVEEASPLPSPRPPQLAERSPGSALALGLAVGFGAGHYYAGETSPGVAFSIVDGLSVAGLFASTFALNELVVQHDLRSGDSLALGERTFGKRERALYVTSWLLLGVEVISRVWQGLAAYQAAERTNEVMSQFVVVPAR